jgi:tetratricopeptide (TPR) repeat protein
MDTINTGLLARVEEALKHYQEPAWLGEQSPLASAYFLGEWLAPGVVTPLERGRCLQKLLAAVAGALSGKYAERSRTLLDEYYFQHRPAAVVADPYLGLGELSQAEAAVQQAIASEEVSVLPDAYRVYGELATRRQDYPIAEHYLQQSLDLAKQNSDPYLAAYAWRALAQLYHAQDCPEQAAAALDQAVEGFRILGLTYEMEKTGLELQDKGYGIQG